MNKKPIKGSKMDKIAVKSIAIKLDKLNCDIKTYASQTIEMRFWLFSILFGVCLCFCNARTVENVRGVCFFAKTLIYFLRIQIGMGIFGFSNFYAQSSQPD